MKRGEVWLINLEPTIGDEIRKTRPAVIVNNEKVGNLDLRIIVPLTSWQDRYGVAPWHVQIVPTQDNGLERMSSADTFQIRSVSTQRFVRKLGSLAEAEMDRILDALTLVLKMYL